jgi:hypothetical protein
MFQGASHGDLSEFAFHLGFFAISRDFGTTSASNSMTICLSLARKYGSLYSLMSRESVEAGRLGYREYSGYPASLGEIFIS